MMKDLSFCKQETLPVFFENPQPITAPPKNIGPYEIKSLFCRGGMSILYLGNLPLSEKKIIIKVLPPKLTKIKEMVERFLEEAKIISLSNHPNIIKLYGQGSWEKGLYIATEFIQGVSLRQFIQNRAFSTKRALEIILQVAYALCHLHNHKIIHRDLKPENILITEDGEIKVIDFGIAQLKTKIEEGASPSTKIIGTPAYMSSEQKKDPSKVSFQTDIYALGIITYELVLGKLSHGTVQLSLLPKDLKKIIEKTLTPAPEKRYQNIVEFITDISKYLNEKALKKDENFEEILDALDTTHALLLPKQFNTSLQLEINSSQRKGTFFSGIYVDYFPLLNNRSLIILAETEKLGIKTLNQASILKGLVKANIYHLQNKKEAHNSIKSFLTSLNQILLEDGLEQAFAFSAILLSPDLNSLSFISCGHNFLFKIGENEEKFQILATNNPLLGKKKDALLLEATCSWNLKDKLFLPSLELLPKITKEKFSPFKKAIFDNMIFPSKIMTDKIIEDLKMHDLKRSAVLLNIERKI